MTVVSESATSLQAAFECLDRVELDRRARLLEVRVGES